MTDYRQDSSSSDRLAVGLGWFSLGLGLAEIVAPDRVARLVGVPATDRTLTVLRVMGLREIAAGAGVLAASNRAPGMWSRVAGDALDLGLLVAGMTSATGDARRGALATVAVSGVAVADVVCARRLSASRRRHPRARGRTGYVHVAAVTTIRRPVQDVYDFWRDFENFPRFMRHLESVRVLDADRSRWRARAPAGTIVEWDAEILGERPNESISWRSLPGADVRNRGAVRFAPAPGDRGTEVRVELEYVPPAGTLGRMVAKLFGEAPEQQVRDDLRRVKQLLETGEVPVSDGPDLSRPAQPAERSAPARTSTEEVPS
jgi:uncharacterized membrane protein